ncbi:hypothetical protein EYF80_007539 [Liparis tanakae]|uniref:Uncharacterized protein n=1 Tax=Liparis tanakae TaxID=230148 RepID=A0A4Z2IWN2_9TELE|nr:hypothetical protein EYF80_007539 [Liparis tanakae]
MQGVSLPPSPFGPIDAELLFQSMDVHWASELQLFEGVRGATTRPREKPRWTPRSHDGKDSFGAEADAWVGEAERQTSATADELGSVSEGSDSEALYVSAASTCCPRTRQPAVGEARDLFNVIKPISIWFSKHSLSLSSVSVRRCSKIETVW